MSKTEIPLQIKHISIDAAHYATKNGKITIEVKGGKKRYKYSFDGGETFQDSPQLSVYGGEYEIVVKDANGNQTEPKMVIVEKFKSELQDRFLSFLFSSFGNESIAAKKVVISYDKSNPSAPKPIAVLDVRVANRWKNEDKDFAELVRIEKEAGGKDHLQDYLEHQALRVAEGGIIARKFIVNPHAERDGNGKLVDVQNSYIAVPDYETIPDKGMIQFLLERKFKETYSKEVQLKPSDGASFAPFVILGDFDEQDDLPPV